MHQLVNYKPDTSPTPEQVEPLTATGFLRTTADITDNQTIYEVDKYFDALEKAMETSMSAVTGLTVGCARCHDHKFDPILQKDYYWLMAAYQAVWDPGKLARGQSGLRAVAQIDFVPDPDGLVGGHQPVIVLLQYRVRFMVVLTLGHRGRVLMLVAVPARRSSPGDDGEPSGIRKTGSRPIWATGRGPAG